MMNSGGSRRPLHICCLPIPFPLSKQLLLTATGHTFQLHCHVGSKDFYQGGDSAAIQTSSVSPASSVRNNHFPNGIEERLSDAIQLPPLLLPLCHVDNGLTSRTDSSRREKERGRSNFMQSQCGRRKSYLDGFRTFGCRSCTHSRMICT